MSVIRITFTDLGRLTISRTSTSVVAGCKNSAELGAGAKRTKGTSLCKRSWFNNWLESLHFFL